MVEKGMASPGQLVQVMADVLGISKGTVTQFDRVLAENGLRTKRGRGRSAAEVTSRDAAYLLIALAASQSANEGPSTCKKFSSLKWLSEVDDDSREGLSKIGVKALANLPDGHCFGAALSALIDSAGTGEMDKFSEGLIWVHFYLASPLSAHIGAKRSPKSRAARFAYFGLSSPPPEGNLIRLSMVATHTITALGRLVHHG
jgi:hypothetical protein